MSARRYLLVVTADGYGKRVALDAVPRTRAGRRGVRVAAPGSALVGGDLMCATTTRC